MSFESRFGVQRLVRVYRFLFLVLFVLLGTGCETLLMRSDPLPVHRQLAPLPPGPICRVAVVPFLNDTDYPLADAIFHKVFAAQFQASGNYLVVQEGDILKIYQQLRLLPGETPTPEQLQIVGRRVNAQLLITGTVMEMRENRDRLGSTDPVIAAEIQIRDGNNGESLWTAYHRRQGIEYQKAMHFGTIHTITGLSRQMAMEIINLWQKKGLKQCDVSPRS
jgi:hypothetical protein